MKQYIVEFETSIPEQERLSIIESVGGKHINNVFMGFELIECDDTAAELLTEIDVIKSVEFNGLCEQLDAEPADFPNQLINVLGNAHEKGFKGDNVIVAVIDSGINYEHEDLQFPIYKQARILNSVVTSTKLEDVKDVVGHGTAVASVIAAQDNGKGYVGVAPNVKMIIVKATTRDENGSAAHSDLAKGIIWAVDNGAQIINLSFSQRSYNSSVAAACKYAFDNNAMVFTCAGNDGALLSYSEEITKSDNVGKWKDYDGTIVIGAVQRNNNFIGKLLPELPIEYQYYKYALIYYNASSKRYRLIVSDQPTTIEAPTTPDTAKFSSNSKWYAEVYDIYPETDLKWVNVRSRISTNYVINWTDSEPLSSTYPNIIFTNHDIIDNLNGGVIHTPIRSMDLYREHFVTTFGHLLPNYDENDLQHIVKAPYSSFGEGIDFVAPGTLNLANASENDSYRKGNGTSYATPIVAGAAALLKQRFPQYTSDEIYRLLKDFAVTIQDGNKNHYGHGMITIPDLSTLKLINKIQYKGKGHYLTEFIRADDMGKDVIKVIPKKPYPAHDHITSGKYFIVLGRLDDTYLLLVLNSPLQNKYAYRDTTTSTGYVYRLKTNDSITYSDYRLENGEWSLRATNTDTMAYNLLTIAESSFDVYDVDQTTLLYNAYESLKNSISYTV